MGFQVKMDFSVTFLIPGSKNGVLFFTKNSRIMDFSGKISISWNSFRFYELWISKLILSLFNLTFALVIVSKLIQLNASRVFCSCTNDGPLATVFLLFSTFSGIKICCLTSGIRKCTLFVGLAGNGGEKRFSGIFAGISGVKLTGRRVGLGGGEVRFFGGGIGATVDVREVDGGVKLSSKPEKLAELGFRGSTAGFGRVGGEIRAVTGRGGFSRSFGVLHRSSAAADGMKLILVRSLKWFRMKNGRL